MAETPPDPTEAAIVGKTLDGVITTWNRSAEHMYGFTAAEAVGQPISIIVPPDRIVEEDEVLRRLGRGETIEHFETVRRRKDGTLLDVSLTVSPIRDADGRVIGVSKVARDISDRKRAERERTELLARERAARAEAEQANRIKDEFLATLSHELRTPLQAMLGWARMLRTGRTDPSGTARALETIERNTRLLAQLVDDVLDVSRITAGTMRLELRPVALVPVIEAAVESVRPAARAKGVQLGLFLDPAVGPVSGDAARLQQVVWNLVSNGIKFTPRGGRVEVHLEQDVTDAEIRVVDTGRGIPAEFLPRVFERFTQVDSSPTRTYGGLGLGLAIARHLVELHGGTVSASSAGDNAGATFTVRLPLRAVRTTDGGRPAPAATARLDGVHVLVVDDDPDARDLLTAALSDAGAAVTAAGSVSEALAAVEAARPDLALCDLAMPEGDGYDFLRALRRRDARLPVAALTARAREEDRRQALAAGFVAHIAKPVDPLDLAEVVARLAGRQAT